VRQATRLSVLVRVATAVAVVPLGAACVDRSDVGAFAAAGDASTATDDASGVDGSAPDDAGDGGSPVVTLTPSTSPLAAGGLSTCGRDANGGAVCWGDNTHGALGIGSFTPGSSAPALGVSGLAKGVRALAGGPFAQCAILDDGTARCWGDSLFGDIGGTTQSVQMPTPHDKTGLSNDVARLSFGASFACALTTSGRGKCWGLGGAGQLGNGSTKDEYAARDVATTEALVDIGASMGGFFACAVTSAGKVLCWGQNGTGQLGSNGTTNQPSPAAVVGLDAAATSIACGREHACALLVDGGVACWGSDALGQLGRGAPGAGGPTPPARVAGVASATSLAVGGDHACVITAGRAVCWGANDAAQIAAGPASLGPTEAAPATFAPVAVTAGYRHTCVVDAKQAVRCFGDGSRKQTGSGTFSL
jgi:hypothetical protein